MRAPTGAHLFGDWDGVEWVSFQPEGRAGLLTHNHTEEIWYVLRGEAEIELDADEATELFVTTLVVNP